MWNLCKTLWRKPHIAISAGIFQRNSWKILRRNFWKNPLMNFWIFGRICGEILREIFKRNSGKIFDKVEKMWTNYRRNTRKNFSQNTWKDFRKNFGNSSLDSWIFFDFPLNYFSIKFSEVFSDKFLEKPSEGFLVVCSKKFR